MLCPFSDFCSLFTDCQHFPEITELQSPVNEHQHRGNLKGRRNEGGNKLNLRRANDDRMKQKSTSLGFFALKRGNVIPSRRADDSQSSLWGGVEPVTGF